MAKYKMEDGTIVNTDKATASFDEGSRFDGRNFISLSTGDQWVHQTLYRSSKGRWYIETTSQWQGSTPSAEYVGAKDAARWLLQNNYGKSIPDELRAHLADIEE